MAEDNEESRAGNGGAVDTASQKARSFSRAQARPQRARDPVNSIEPARKPDRNLSPHAIAAVAESAAAPSASPVASSTQRADTDSWTVPQSVRDRFVQDGHRFYFPDGAAAFKDRARRLTTASENTQVIHSLIEIAHSRGWTEVAVSGTERFRQDAWRQARLAGLEVRGYRPSEDERAQLIRALGRNLVRSLERVDSISADAAPSVASPTRDATQAPGDTTAQPRERITGRSQSADEIAVFGWPSGPPITDLGCLASRQSLRRGCGRRHRAWAECSSCVF